MSTHTLVQGPSSEFFLSDEDKRVCRAQVADECTDAEFELFWAFCKNRRLNPLTNQVFPVMRKQRVNGEWERYMTITVSIDGLVAIADRTRCYAPSDKETRFEFNPNAKPQDKKYPVSCTVWVLKYAQGMWHEYPATVRWDELCPVENRNGQVQVGYMWQKMPTTMLEKCALAKALRRGFPEDLGGIYISEEMEQATAAQRQQERAEAAGGKVEDADAVQTRGRQRGKLKKSTEENRGHGNENIESLAGNKTPEFETWEEAAEHLTEGLHECPVCKSGVIDVSPDGDAVHLAGEQGDISTCPGRAQAAPEAANSQRKPLPDGDRVSFLVKKIDYKTRTVTDKEHPEGKRTENYIFVHSQDGKQYSCFRTSQMDFFRVAKEKTLPVTVITKSKESGGKTYVNILAIAKLGTQEFDGDGPVETE